MTARRVVAQPRPPKAAAVATDEVGRYAAFIEKHVGPDVAQRLPVPPVAPLSDDVGAALFVRVYRFF